MHISRVRADLDAIRGEIGKRVADPSTNTSKVTRLQAISSIFKDAPLTSTGREIEGCQTVGGLSFCLAVASHIVRSEKSTYSVGTGSQASSSSDGASRGGTTSRLSIKQPTSMALLPTQAKQGKMLQRPKASYRLQRYATKTF